MSRAEKSQLFVGFPQEGGAVQARAGIARSIKRLCLLSQMVCAIGGAICLVRFAWLAICLAAPAAIMQGDGLVVSSPVWAGPVRYVLEAAALMAATRFFGAIVHTVRPFDLPRCRELKIVAALLALAAALPALLSVLAASLHLGGTSVAAASIEPVDLPLLSCGIFLSVLADVFRLGCVLQDQDDGLV